MLKSNTNSGNHIRQQKFDNHQGLSLRNQLNTIDHPSADARHLGKPCDGDMLVYLASMLVISLILRSTHDTWSNISPEVVQGFGALLGI